MASHHQVECHLRAFGLRCFTTVSMREEGKDAVPPGATRPAESESMEGRPRPAEGPTRDRLTLQLAISVRGQLQICNSAPLHAGPILPRSTRLAELYLARRGYDGAASAQPRVVTDRRATRNNSQDQSTRKGNQEWHCPRRQELQQSTCSVLR